MYKPSNYIPSDLEINAWKDIQPFFQKLLTDKVQSVIDLEALITHYSEVLSMLCEEQARAYINITCHTDNKDFQDRFEVFSTQITPEAEKAGHQIEEKIVSSPFFNDLPEERYLQLKRELKRNIELYFEENVILEAKLSTLTSKFNQRVGALVVKVGGQELTIPQASVGLESSDRNLRQETWQGILDARLGAKKDLDEIFDQMIVLRDQTARNVKYSSYRDYKHDDLQRFDYTVDDVLMFHEAVKKHVMPLTKKVELKHIERLGLDVDDYRPWDFKAKPASEKPLVPFKKGSELLEKTISIFQKIHPDFRKNLEKMHQSKLFDLESRQNKALGGYNYGLETTGMPFIFMNAVGIHTDVITLVHEGGHAMHNFLTNHESLIQYRNFPSELAEVASMSMELISSKHWDEFYNQKDLVRARLEHFEDIIKTFSWVSIIDSFQHWIYTHPKHTHESRDSCFDKLMIEYGTGLVNWGDHERHRGSFWQKQMHIFEVPFYYIEYAFAQLGALQIYRNYVKDPKATLNAYIKGLSLGGSESLPDVWAQMGISFDFSEEALCSLVEFMEQEWSELCAAYEKLF